MRLAITKSGHYSADVYCADARAARKLLREKPVSILAIGFHLAGRDDGESVLRWAHQNRLLPGFVVVIEHERTYRERLCRSLESLGYRSGDRTTYVRQ